MLASRWINTRHQIARFAMTGLRKIVKLYTVARSVIMYE